MGRVCSALAEALGEVSEGSSVPVERPGRSRVGRDGRTVGCRRENAG